MAIFSESYKHILQRGKYKEFIAVLKQFALCTLSFVLLLFFMHNEDKVDRLFLLIWLGIAFVITYCERFLWKKLLIHRADSTGKRAMLIVTTGNRMSSVLNNIKNNNVRYVQLLDHKKKICVYKNVSKILYKIFDVKILNKLPDLIKNFFPYIRPKFNFKDLEADEFDINEI